MRVEDPVYQFLKRNLAIAISLAFIIPHSLLNNWSDDQDNDDQDTHALNGRVRKLISTEKFGYPSFLHRWLWES